MVPERIRERYMRDPLPVRLGGLAMDLARIASCADDPRDRDALISLLEEGKWFAEWTATDAPVNIQEQLAEIQLQLALWQRRWLAGHAVPTMRIEAQRWSEALLELSGLLQQS